MTELDLERLVLEGDPQKLVHALAPLDERQRQKLTKTAMALLRQARADQREAFRTRREISNTEKPFVVETMARLAIFGVGPWSAISKISASFWMTGYADPTNFVYQVLVARRPQWIDHFMEAHLNDRFCDWQLIRRLVRYNGFKKPTSDAYILEMLRSHAGRVDFKTPLVDVLRQDPELLRDEIWRIFEIDLSRERAFDGDDEPPHPISWRQALVALASSGELDRQRVLTASLVALSRRLAPQNASWFCRFHESLAPTLDERAARQPLYVDLLGQSIAKVVAFALAAIKVLCDEGKLDSAPFISAVGPALELKEKIPPTAAARLLREVARQSPEHAPAVAVVAARGLTHPSVDVQKICVDVIEAGANGADDALAPAIESKLESVAPSQRPRVDAILARITAESRTETPPADAGQEDWSPAELEQINPKWRAVAGIDDCLRGLNEGGDPPPLQFHPMSVPRLDPSARLTPIENFDELIDRLSAAVEGLNDPDELELLLDGLSRLSERLPIDFAVRTAPLLKRVTDLIQSADRFTHMLDPLWRLRLLVQAWVKRERLTTIGSDISLWAHEGFIAMRMVGLSRQIARGLFGPMLACPTHRGGWIDPRELVRRIQFWQELASELPPERKTFYIPEHYDLVQSLLRIAPDHRSQALTQATTLSGESGAAVRFALGANESIGKTIALWIAAARSRDPWGTFDSLAAVHGALGPGGASPAQYQWEAAPPNVQESWRAHPTPELRLTITPPVSTEHLQLDRPTVLLNNPNDRTYGFDTILTIRCRAMIWPANPDATFHRGAGAIMSRLNDPPSTLSPIATYLEPLFDPDVPFSDMAQLALALGLLAKDSGARGLAIDAAIALIEDGRCTGEAVGAIYGKLARIEGTVRLNRLAESVAQITRISALNERVGLRILQSALATLPVPPPPDLHYLLSPLHELSLKIGEPLPENCRAVLQVVAGSGKTAKLAKSLLGLPAAPDESHRRQCLIGAINGRMQRAKHWSLLDAADLRL